MTATLARPVFTSPRPEDRGSGPRRLTSRSLTGAPPTAARTKLENE